jgi:hypothetical protein
MLRMFAEFFSSLFHSPPVQENCDRCGKPSKNLKEKPVGACIIRYLCPDCYEWEAKRTRSCDRCGWPWKTDELKQKTIATGAVRNLCPKCYDHPYD